MKKTLLKDCYCLPENDDEWKLSGLKKPEYNIPYGVFELDGKVFSTNSHLLKAQGRTKIPVSRFVDLLEDRIVGWRLEEIHGHVSNNGSYYWEFYRNRLEVEYSMIVRLNDELIYINTLTELEQQLKFLGHETN